MRQSLKVVGLGRERVEPCVQRNSTTGSSVSPVSKGVPSSMFEFLSTYYYRSVNLDVSGPKKGTSYYVARCMKPRKVEISGGVRFDLEGSVAFAS